MALIGYARTSTDQQELDLQYDAFDPVGLDRVFVEKASAIKTDRPELAAALDYLRPGDTFVVWKLDRVGRSVKHLAGILEDLREREIEFRSLTEGIDTGTPGGRLIYHVLSAVAQFERELIIERTNAGLAAARARGRVGGRPAVMTPEKLEVARQMIEAGGNTIGTIAKTIGVSRATLYRYL